MAEHALATVRDEWAFSEEELRAIREVYAPGATNEQFQVFIAECKRRRLQPGRQVYFTLRTTKVWDPEIRQEVTVKRPVYMISIDALRVIAQRSNQYAGQKPLAWYYIENGQPSKRVERIPLPQLQPYAAEAVVLRHDFTEPMVRSARWDAYVQGWWKDGKFAVNNMWKTRGPEQLAKCSEAQALRAAFPEDLWGLYIPEEFPEEPNNDHAHSQVAEIVSAPLPSVPPPLASPKPAIQQGDPLPSVVQRQAEAQPAQPGPYQATDDDVPDFMRAPAPKAEQASLPIAESAPPQQPPKTQDDGFVPLPNGAKRAERIKHLDKWVNPEPGRNLERAHQLTYYLIFCAPKECRALIESRPGWLDMAKWNAEFKKLSTEERDAAIGILEGAAATMGHQEFLRWATENVERVFGNLK